MRQQPGLGPVLNLDSNQEFKLSPNNRLPTRGQLHRILKANNISHDVNWGYQVLYNLLVQHGLNFQFVPPGVIQPPKTKEEEISDLEKKLSELKGDKPRVEMMKDGWPRSVFVLRKWCRDRKIPCTNKDKRDELIEKLKNGQDAA